MTRSPSRPFFSLFMGPRKRARRESATNGANTASAITPAITTTETKASLESKPSTGTDTISTGTIPSATTSSSALSASTATTNTLPPNLGPAASSPVVNSIKASGQVRKSRSWYGSWPRIPKSTASTPEVARESIMGGTSKPKATPDFSRFETKKPVDVSLLDSLPSADLVADAGPIEGDDSTLATAANVVEGPDLVMPPTPQASATQVLDGSTDNNAKMAETESVKEPQRPSPGWLGWFGTTPRKAPKPSSPIPIAIPDDITEDQAPKEEPVVSAVSTGTVEPQPPSEEPLDGSQVADQPIRPTTSGSWFPLWSSSPSKLPVDPPDSSPPEEPCDQSQLLAAQEQEDVVMEDARPSSPKPQPSPSAGSTWAFWSRESKSKSKGKEYCPSEPGELAVIGERSEDHPKPAKAVEIEDETPSKEQAMSKSSPSKSAGSTNKKPKRARPQSMDIDELVPQSPSTPIAESSKSGAETPRKASTSKSATPAKPLPPNLLLPSFDSTYQMKENPSILRQIAELLLRTRQPPAKHVFRPKEAPKIRKALAIGVHGLFPASYLRPMIGQPTGTSIKFANHGAEAIRRWAEDNGCEGVEIEKVALEGEGKIGERVDNLWRLLLNWIDHIREADFIMICCHSQGVPVSIMLVAKLIDLGIITSGKIGVCAMAGVSLGPFPEYYKSGMGMLMGSAAELWQFSNPESEVSQRYEHALKEVLAYGVRITYIGSLDDQLVPIESAVYSPATHPYIYRAVFIDGRIHAPDFISHLVGFALKLRNLGISDHGLIRELSIPLAGSLYGGAGHSRLYDDGQVYDLAVLHALETTDVKHAGCHVQKHEGLINPNPYHLPWIMRGLLEENIVKTELTSETSELLRQFDDWKPSSKALKDVKYRLEAVRSKL